MMGIRLMLNFNNPYLATSLGDFWSRWHISLSTWFRDYVYIPLGGNRLGNWMLYRNLFLTFVVSGLWHGAAWTFVIWGALHGTATLATRLAERSRWYREQFPKFAKQLLVFAFVCVTWIFFRAESVSDAGLIVNRIFTASWLTADGIENPPMPILALILVASVWLYQFIYESRLRRLLQISAVRVVLVAFMILYLMVSPESGEQPFIYFQF